MPCQTAPLSGKCLFTPGRGFVYAADLAVTYVHRPSLARPLSQRSFQGSLSRPIRSSSLLAWHCRRQERVELRLRELDPIEQPVKARRAGAQIFRKLLGIEDGQ